MADRLKKLARERMKRTGENYTTARMRVLEEAGREAPRRRPDPDAPETSVSSQTTADAPEPVRRTGSLSEYKRQTDARVRASKGKP